MTERLIVPIKKVGNDKWGALAYIAHNFHIVGEKVDLIEKRFTFAGQHRVQLYSFKKNVYFKIPDGTTLDITDVQPTRRQS
jgi:hypothetical protein